MRHRAIRLLHVLACAPVAALVAASQVPWSTHVLAADAPVIAIDAGHGGSADNAHPAQPFDPGVIGVNGLQEKDVTLDVARRVAALLQQDGARVVMTRSDDTFIDIGPRMQAAINAGAQLFVSIHFNSFTNPSTGGELVLYPNAQSQPFAQLMADTVGRDLNSWGITDDGSQPKPDLWQHATMPAVTVEGAYLSNPREAALLKRSDFRDALAASVVDGLEHQMPSLAAGRVRAVPTAPPNLPTAQAAPTGPAVSLGGTRPSQPVAAGGTRHPASAPPRPAVAAPAAAGGGGHTLLILAVLAGLAALAWRFRQRLAWALLDLRPVASRMLHRLVAGVVEWAGSDLLPQTRGRRLARRRALLQRTRRAPVRQSVYDRLWF